MSTDLAALLEACKDAPDDLTLRLILADWIADHDEAKRSELVRLSCALTGADHLAKDEPDYALQEARFAELQRGKQGHSWFTPGPMKQHVRWWAGLCDVHGVSPADLPSLLDRLPEELKPWLETVGLNKTWSAEDLHRFAPVLTLFRRLRLDSQALLEPLQDLLSEPTTPQFRQLIISFCSDRDGTLTSLLRCPALAGLRWLELFNSPLAEGGKSLVGAPFLDNVRVLKVYQSGLTGGSLASILRDSPPRRLRVLDCTGGIGDEGLAALAASPAMSELGELHLSTCYLTDEGLKALAASPHLRRFEELNLWHNYTVRDAGLEALAASEVLAPVRRLNLEACSVGIEGLRALASSSYLGSLQELDLSLNWSGGLQNKGARVLATAAGLAGLRALRLNMCKIGPRGVVALARSPHLSRLEVLDLGKNPLRSEGLTALAESTGLPCLRSLWLEDTKIGADGLKALAASMLFERLQSLNLAYNPLLPEAVFALASGRQPRSLLALNLARTGLEDEGLQMLVTKPGLFGVRSLDLSGNRITAAGVRALVESQPLPSLSRLILDGNEIGDEGGELLADWNQLDNLAELELSGTGISTDCEKRIQHRMSS
jgi:uncharacterized protein (TIGR02996 family)